MENVMEFELLDEARNVVFAREKERSKGRDFNVFLIQKTASDEVKVCKFLRELLDPNGSHGQKTLFLKSFVECVLKISDDVFSEIDFELARVATEETIQDNRRIDVVIHIKNRLLPIEVKIFAGDQDKQCFDYYNYAKMHDGERAVIYYLTLDGHEPSEMSKGDIPNGGLKCRSFFEDVSKWLAKCISAVSDPPIGEVLRQFSNALTGIKEEGDYSMELEKKIGTDSNYVKGAIEIESSLQNVKTHKMCEVFDKIKTYMLNRGYNILICDYETKAKDYYLTHSNTWPSLNIQIPNLPDEYTGKIALAFEIESRLYYGIRPFPLDKKVEDDIKEFVKQKYGEEKNTGKWYWWKHLDEGINYRDCNPQYLQLFDEKYFEEYMKGIYSKIDNEINQLFMT